MGTFYDKGTVFSINKERLPLSVKADLLSHLKQLKNRIQSFFPLKIVFVSLENTSMRAHQQMWQRERKKTLSQADSVPDLQLNLVTPRS